MWFAFNLMLDKRAMTITVCLAPWSEGQSLSFQCYDFVFTQYSFCKSFRHCSHIWGMVEFLHCWLIISLIISFVYLWHYREPVLEKAVVILKYGLKGFLECKHSGHHFWLLVHICWSSSVLSPESKNVFSQEIKE